MNGKESNTPPRLALWLLRRVPPGSDNEALAGDLVEQFREGRPARWFWKQVLLAIAVGMWAGIGRHGAEVSYAVAGTGATIFLGPVVHATRTIVPWWRLPWPASMLVFDLGTPSLLALAALPALAVALLVNGNFRWASLLRTAAISLPMIAIPYYLRIAVLARPGREVGSGQDWIMAVIFGILPPFLALFASAWLGCRQATASTAAVHRAEPRLSN